MINPTTVVSAPASAAATGRRTEIGKEGFLAMLVTQLRNQDPLSPLQPHEFAAQLAQFSSVEQLTQLNQAMEQQLQTGQLNALIGKTTFSAALIGKLIVAEGNQVSIPASGSGSVRVEVGGSGGQATLRLLDASGREVAKRDLGRVPAGLQTLTLPSDLPAGDYRYEIKVTGDANKAVPVTAYTVGVVDGVSFKDGQILLRLGTLEVALDTVAVIESAPAAVSGSMVTQVPRPSGAATGV